MNMLISYFTVLICVIGADKYVCGNKVSTPIEIYTPQLMNKCRDGVYVKAPVIAHMHLSLPGNFEAFNIIKDDIASKLKESKPIILSALLGLKLGIVLF